MIRAAIWFRKLKAGAAPAFLAIFFILLSACRGAAQETEPPPEASPPAVASQEDSGEDVPPPANPDPMELVPEPPRTMDSPDATFPAGGRSAPPEITEEPEELPQGPDVPAREAAGDEFFSDAAFVGNSLVDGFRLFSGLATCDYYAATSMSVAGVGSANVIALKSGAMGTIYQGLSQRQYGKIYIMLGINEIGYATSVFKEMYAGMLDTIRGIQPDATIYIMSLTPVSAHKSATDTTFTMERVIEYNKALYELAGEKGCWYIDLVQALSDETGFLPANVTSDGIHFSADHYKTWLEYMRTHYV